LVNIPTHSITSHAGGGSSNASSPRAELNPTIMQGKAGNAHILGAAASSLHARGAIFWRELAGSKWMDDACMHACPAERESHGGSWWRQRDEAAFCHGTFFPETGMRDAFGPWGLDAVSLWGCEGRGACFAGGMRCLTSWEKNDGRPGIRQVVPWEGIDK
jgi:hypothetical protein